MKINCPLCHSDVVRHLFSSSDKEFLISGKFDYFECSGCGVWFMFPQPDEELKTYYPENYYTARAIHKNARKERIREETLGMFLNYPFKTHFYAPLLKPFLFKLYSYPWFVPGGKVLDVGCGQGYFMRDLRAVGWDVYGIDMNKNAVDFCRKTGLENVTLSSIEELDLPEMFFDAVTMVHVLEHFRDPMTAIKRLARFLKPNGELVITVPNHCGLSSKIFGSDWFGLEAPRHLFIYNKSSLAMLLRAAGFSVEKIFTSNSLGDFSHSLLYRRRDLNLNTLHELIRHLGFFLDPILSLSSAGDQVTVRARKK